MENKAQNAITWIEGLETTEHKQAAGSLGDELSGFCCIGFGCFTLKVPFEKDDEVDGVFQEKVGLLTIAGESNRIGAKYKSLVSMNDVHHLSFKEIAEEMKKNPASFFEEEVAKEISEHFKKQV